jgi:hypothetical protein
MPYIKANDGRREALRRGEPALTAGELNYQIFYHVKHGGYSEYSIKNFVCKFLGEKPNYQRYNDMTGALIRCHKELKRRFHKNVQELKQVMQSYDDEIAKYEDKKIEENGDVE